MRKQLLYVLLAIALVMGSNGVNVQAEEIPKCNTVKEVIKEVRARLLDRDTSFGIIMTMETAEDLTVDGQVDVFGPVMRVDNKKISTDSDYLKLNTSEVKAVKTTPMGTNSIKVIFEAKYLTTKKKEQAIQLKITQVLKALKIGKASDYTKVKRIHDYVVKRMTYDQDLEEFDAYTGLIKGTGVCQSYALAAYRLLNDAGVECRIITGQGNGESHAWNIVKVDGLWYNLDCTWDDPIASDGKERLTYDYFLKNEEEFADHTRDSEYTTDKFLSAYPISDESY